MGRDQQGVTLMQSGLRCHSAIAKLVITIKRRQCDQKRALYVTRTQLRSNYLLLITEVSGRQSALDHVRMDDLVKS